MAVIKEFTVIPDSVDMFDGIITARTSTFIDIKIGHSFTHLTGSGLTYDAQGFITDGYLTGLSFTMNGHLALSITGSWASVLTMSYAASSSSNAERFMFTRDDVFCGYSGGRDDVNLGTGNDTFYGGGGNDTCLGDFGADKLYGQNGNDTLKGGDNNDLVVGGAGDDTLYGDAGRDVITGGKGTDKMFGGLGGDRFVFNNVSEIGLGVKRDIIFDFFDSYGGSEGDKIDLSAIDANASVPGNGRFNPIGDTPFSHTAGELRLSNGVLSGDVNGDALADFQIRLAGIYTTNLIGLIL